MKTTLLIICSFCLIFTNCTDKKESNNNESVIIKNNVQTQTLTERVDTNNLIILYPSFSKVNLVCKDMPQKQDKTVVLFAEAAYTAAPLDNTFNHKKIAGNHVSNGVKHQGFKCSRNTGAFVYYSGKWKFLYKDYASELDSAAKNGGAAFAQELIIHKSTIKHTKRRDGNINTFRALCEINKRLCIIESKNNMRFGDFKSSLLEVGVSNAIYLDMGSGWNHAWYRINSDSIVELHPKVHNFCTNWITFYK